MWIEQFRLVFSLPNYYTIFLYQTFHPSSHTILYYPTVPRLQSFKQAFPHIPLIFPCPFFKFSISKSFKLLHECRRKVNVYFSEEALGKRVDISAFKEKIQHV